MIQLGKEFATLNNASEGTTISYDSNLAVQDLLLDGILVDMMANNALNSSLDDVSDLENHLRSALDDVQAKLELSRQRIRDLEVTKHALLRTP